MGGGQGLDIHVGKLHISLAGPPFLLPSCFRGSGLAQRADLREIHYSLCLSSGSWKRPVGKTRVECRVGVGVHA